MTFSDWYESIWTYPPFPWQTKFAKDWARAIAVPTGCGKTSVIDAWLYRHLHGSDASRRLWYVVDRRVLVDGAWRRAQELVSHTNADVQVLRLRGGTFEDAEMPRPDQPAIICSTVDQFGSRLLMQGYGVGNASRPLHAALAGTDATVVVDEAHISVPLMQTINAARQHGADVSLIVMSATLAGAHEALTLSGADLRHPVLAQRLSATKVAALKSGSTATLAKQANELRKQGARAIVVWANTVDYAVQTARELAKNGKTILITGRDRQYERDRTMDMWHEQLKSGANENPEVFVVSTQCLEVGVDWDFEGMVTECASMDALRQRFGRLDRLGQHGTTRAVITKARSQRGKIPVYGSAAKEAWNWLGSIATDKNVDFGLSNEPLSDPPPETLTVTSSAPFLTESHLDSWSMTGKVGNVSSTSAVSTGVELPGLRGDSLLGFLAALGVSRLTGCRLAWKKSGPLWLAMLETECGIADLAELLMDRCRQNPLEGCNKKLALEQEQWDSLSEEWKLAIGAWRETDFIRSPLIAIRGGGHQYPVTTIDSINQELTVDEMAAALVGPWIRHQRHGFRFEPTEYRRHGDQWTNPSSDPAFVARAPTRLAIEVLPLLPTLSHSTHVMCRNKNKLVTWVVWRDWLLPQAITARIALGIGDQRWECDRLPTGQAQSSFTPARPSRHNYPPAVPEVSPWLHGADHAHQDVKVLWRNDTSVDAIRAMPPTLPETATIPIGRLNAAQQSGLIDTATRWRGSDDCEIVRDFKPGDVIVVRAGTSDLSPSPSTDIAEEASDLVKRPRIRLLGSDAQEWMDTLNDVEILSMAGEVKDLSAFQNPEITAYPGGFVIFERYVSSEQSTQQESLEDHSVQVAELAAAMAQACELSKEMVDELRTAAMWHDVGKADPRFQLWLQADDEILAKSGHTRAQMRAAWQASGYPRGQRHELLSAEMAKRAGKSTLVQHLIAMHHGRCRPLCPPQPDASPLQVNLEWDGASLSCLTHEVPSDLEDSFWSLQSDLGYWRLALLSGILVAADHIASATPTKSRVLEHST